MKPHSKSLLLAVPFLLASLALGMASTSGTIDGVAVEIVDGDTFTLLTSDKKQVTIRVAEIDAPERGQPYASKARQQLSALLFRKTVSVHTQVVDSYGRLVGRPFVGDLDVSAEMVRTGSAWVYRTYSEDLELYQLEKQARQEKRGLWNLSEFAQIPPWQWRSGKRSPSDPAQTLQAFQCGTKTYCREMVSCDEAKFYLQSCHLNRLDGDGDSIPCEAICR